MLKINVRRVIIGGVIAGIIIFIVDVVLYGVILKAPMAVAMAKLSLMPNALRSAEIPWYMFVDLSAGILLLWLYAAIRPRFGGGPRTAAIAGLAGWLFAGFLCNLITLPMGIMSFRLITITIGVMLIQYILAAVIGARFYAEDGAQTST